MDAIRMPSDNQFALVIKTRGYAVFPNRLGFGKVSTVLTLYSFLQHPPPVCCRSIYSG